jgi:hypothetical protein
MGVGKDGEISPFLDIFLLICFEVSPTKHRDISELYPPDSSNVARAGRSPNSMEVYGWENHLSVVKFLNAARG